MCLYNRNCDFWPHMALLPFTGRSTNLIKDHNFQKAKLPTYEIMCL